MEGIRRKYLLERLVTELGSVASLLAPVPTEDRTDKTPAVGDMGYSRAEMEILNLVNGMRPIEEIVFLSGQKVATVYQVLLAATTCGILAVVVKGVGGATGIGEDSIQKSLEISRRRIEAKLEQVDHASYFDVLGVTPSATPYEVEEAYKRLSREFDPLNYSHASLSDLNDKIDTIQKILEDAHDVLSDNLLREGYRQSISSKN